MTKAQKQAGKMAAGDARAIRRDIKKALKKAGLTSKNQSAKEREETKAFIAKQAALAARREAGIPKKLAMQMIKNPEKTKIKISSQGKKRKGGERVVCIPGTDCRKMVDTGMRKGETAEQYFIRILRYSGKNMTFKSKSARKDWLMNEAGKLARVEQGNAFVSGLKAAAARFAKKQAETAAGRLARAQKKLTVEKKR